MPNPTPYHRNINANPPNARRPSRNAVAVFASISRYSCPFVPYPHPPSPRAAELLPVRSKGHDVGAAFSPPQSRRAAKSASTPPPRTCSSFLRSSHSVEPRIPLLHSSVPWSFGPFSSCPVENTSTPTPVETAPSTSHSSATTSTAPQAAKPSASHPSSAASQAKGPPKSSPGACATGPRHRRSPALPQSRDGCGA